MTDASLGHVPRFVLLALLATAAWTFADLYLRVSLPGASELGLASFSALAGAARLAEAHRPPTGVLLAGAVLGAGMLLGTRRGRRGLDVLAPLLLVFPTLGLCIGLLMERSAGGAALLAVVVAGALGLLSVEPGRRPLRGFGAALAAVSVVCVAASSRYVYLLLQAEPSYALLQDLGERFRDGSVDPATPLTLLQACVTVAVGVVLAARSPRARRRGLAVGMSVLSGAIAFVALNAAFEDAAAVGPSLVTVLDAVLLACLVVPEARIVRGALPRVRRVGLGLVLPAAVGGLLLSQAYASRVFRCPGDDAPMERIATTSQLFRIVLTEDGSTGLMAARDAAHLLRMQLQPTPGRPMPIDTGDIRGGAEWPTKPFEMLGQPEELIWVPGTREFLGTMVTPHHYRNPDFESGGACDDPLEFGTLLFRVGEDAARLEQVFTVPQSCWIGAMAWEPESQRVLLGWEYQAGFSVLDPATMNSERVAWPTSSGMGDVAAVEVSDIDGRTRVFSVSLWGRSGLTELHPTTLEPLRSVALGGVNYDLAIDAVRGRIYVSSYYASRVQVVDAASFTVVGSIPTGLGTRGLRVDVERDLLLISSVYDGELRVWDLATDTLAGRHLVGGHVKDIALDSARGLAYLWSQCGLLRMDLSPDGRAAARRRD